MFDTTLQSPATTLPLSVPAISPNSTTLSHPPVPPLSIPEMVPWIAPVLRGGKAQRETYLLRESVVRYLHESGHPELVRQAYRIENCCTEPPCPSAPPGWYKPCRAEFCPACGLRLSWDSVKKRQRRLWSWHRGGDRICHAIITFPHCGTDGLTSVANAMLETFNRMRRSKKLNRALKDYAYGIHVKYGARSPHPHTHLVFPVDSSPRPDDCLRAEIELLFTSIVAPITERVSKRHFGEIRHAGPVPCKIVSAAPSRREIINLAYYIAKPIVNAHGDIPFWRLTQEEFLDLLSWVRGHGERRRRLCGFSQSPVNYHAS